MKGRQDEDLHLPLALIIDLVNHLYIFCEGAREIDEDFSRHFIVSYTLAESGLWWRFLYGVSFHTALHQIARRVRGLTERELREEGAVLSREEALHFLPYLEEVETILSVWRHPTLPADERKRLIAKRFPEEIARALISPGKELLLNQFYEEGMVLGGSGMSNYFTYLDSCPLRKAQKSSLNLREAIAYWAWIDNVKAFRTFANEEGVKNPRVVRMQQAVLFSRLVERLPKRKMDFSVVTLKLSPFWFDFLHTQDLPLLALVADSYGSNPWFNYYDQGVFIEHTTPGDAFRALKTQMDIQLEQYEANFAQKSMLLLKASAINIMNHQEILQERLLVDRHRSIDPLLIANRLMEQAEMMKKPHSFHCVDSLEGVGSFQDVLCVLETAKCLTDCIAESDPFSRQASAGLIFILKQIKGEVCMRGACSHQTVGI